MSNMTTNDDHITIRSRGKALQMTDEAITARIAAVDYHCNASDEVREIWAGKVEFAKNSYSAEHLAGRFVPRVRKALARWASGKGKLPLPAELRFLAAIAAYDEVAR